MSRAASDIVRPQAQASVWAKQAAIVIGASLFVALCAKVTLPLPTAVPLTLQNFGVLVVGLLLGSRRGFAALSLYLVEGALGLPVFNPTGPGGVAQLLGPTGGYLMAYPFVAFAAGLIYERTARRFTWAAISALAGEVILFVVGLSWLAVLTRSWSIAFKVGLYWFVFAETIKIMMAAAVASRWYKRVSRRGERA